MLLLNLTALVTLMEPTTQSQTTATVGAAHREMSDGRFNIEPGSPSPLMQHSTLDEPSKQVNRLLGVRSYVIVRPSSSRQCCVLWVHHPT
jgi:hypothetical protein